MDTDFTLTPQEMVLNWIQTLDQNDRIGYIKSLVECCPFEDVKPLRTMLANTHKRKRPSPRNFAKNLKKRRTSSLPSPEVVPESTQVVPLSTEGELKASYWWEDFSLEEIVSIDTEMVALHKTSADGRHIHMAATVSILDFHGKELYNTRVYHRNGSFIVTDASLAITGFRGNSLEDGEPFEVVKQKVIDILDGKLIVTCNGADFRALKIPSGDLNCFEFHNHWMKWNGSYDMCGEKVYQPISLKRLYRHYFGIDIQRSGQPHSASVDAMGTIKLFKDSYIPWAKENSPTTKYQQQEGEFDNIL